MKTIISILTGIAAIAVVTVWNTSSVNMNVNSNKDQFVSEMKLNKGSYWASEFAQFKKENLRADQFEAEKVSEKVIFKAFVKHKDAEDSK